MRVHAVVIVVASHRGRVPSRCVCVCDPRVQVGFWKELCEVQPAVKGIESQAQRFVTVCARVTSAFTKVIRMNPDTVHARLEFAKFLLEVC